MSKIPTTLRSDREISELDEDVEIEELIKNHNALVKKFNFVIKALSLRNNFNCYIEKATFQASGDAASRDTQRIQHFLGVVPKYRIILRQTGNGVLEDVTSGWTDKFITMKNRGSEIVTATIMIVRE